MLNEDLASCELMYVRRMSSKHQRCSMLEEGGVSWSTTQHHEDTAEQFCGDVTVIVIGLDKKNCV